MISPKLWAAPAVALTLLLAACGGSDDGKKTTPADAEIVSFTADPAEVAEAGDLSRISWSVRNATQISLHMDGEEIPLEDPAALEGSVELAILRETDFRLFATGPSGVRATGELRVTLASAPDPDQPKILSFVADPPTIRAGEETTLSWATTDADRIRIVDEAGEPIDLAPAAAAEGSVTLLLAESARFTLTAYHEESEREATATVEVEVEALPIEAPTIEAFEAPAFATADELGQATVALSWTGVLGAAEVILEADTLEPTWIDPSQLPTGGMEVSISEDTTFRLIARNEAGDVEAIAQTLLVEPPSIVAFVASPEQVGAGETIDVEWETSGASEVQLLVDGIDWEVAPELTSGAAQVQLAANAELELRAFNQAGDFVSKQLSIEVGEPVIVSFEGSKQRLWLGETLVLSWEAVGGSHLLVTSGGATVCETRDLQRIAAGSCDLPITEAGIHDFRIEVSNGSGEATSTFSISAANGALIVAFAAAPAQVSVGEDVIVSWEVVDDPDGVVPSLSMADQHGTTYPLPSGTTGSTTLSFDEAGSVELELMATSPNPLSIPAIAAATVEVFGPPAVTLVASHAEFDDSVAPEVILSWTSQNAAELILHELDEVGSPRPLYTVPDAERASGSLGVRPAVATTYWIVAKNGAGADASQDVRVTVAPMEILSFTATPAEIVAGDSLVLEWTTRMAQSVDLDILSGPGLLREETQEPYLDVEALGGTHLPLGTACSTSIATYGCELFEFPDGFLFPFAGQDRDAVRVYGNGILSFDTTHTTSSSTSNSQFPTSSSYQWAHLAPFWDSLGWSDAYPAGNIHTLYDESDPRGPFVAIQWKDHGFSAHRDTASLNFEVILWQSGDVEYRYGAMERGTGTAGWENGSSATIGYQYPGSTASDTIAYNTSVRVRDPLAGRSFAYRVVPDLATSGTFEWHPYATTDSLQVGLTAVAASTETATSSVEVIVHRRAILDVVQPPPPEIDAGESFRIGWTSLFADSIEIVDGTGTVRCTSSPETVEAGFCPLEEGVPGPHTYVVRATGALGHEVERSFTVDVIRPFEIVSFDAPEEVDNGSDVTLSWVTDGDDLTVELQANGVDVPLPGGGLPSGSVVVPGLEEDTDFVLVVKNLRGIVREASRTVVVRPISLVLTASETAVRPGTSVTIQIDAESLVGLELPQVFGTLPMADVGAVPYVDIRPLPGAQQLTTNNGTTGSGLLALPTGFEFPYFGETYTQIRVFIDGYATFDTVSTAAGTGSNERLPSDASAAIKRVHLAPFWEDLDTRNIGAIWYAQPQDDEFVIQWTTMSRSTGSSTSNTYDLNFQLALFADGSFEYRYGAMTPPPTTSTLCYPSSCVEESNGSSATIGYQDPDATMGYLAHFGGSGNNAANIAYPGGLAGKTLRYQAFEGSAIITATPTETTTYTICAKTAAGTICREVVIEADFGVSYFEPSAYVVDWNQGVTLTWMSRGGSILRLYENDTLIRTESSPASMDAGIMPVVPTRDTVYTLVLEALANKATSSTSVAVRRSTLDVNVSPSSISSGDEATVSWTVGVADPSLNPVVLTPMQEDPSLFFDDLTWMTDVELLIGPDVDTGAVTFDFDEDFSFPYLGIPRSAVRVASDGFLTFDLSAASTPTNQRLPNATYQRVHLAPFWEDLHTRLNGQVLAARIDADTYVIQWNHMSLFYGSDDSNESNLNFQVVLHRDGRFEYRYGDMLPSPAGGSSTDCYPQSCENEANGSSATIGYQDTKARVAQLIHFGGTNRGASQKPIPGGLAHRSWKFTPASSSGSMTMPFDETTDLELCMIEPDSDDMVCAEPVRIDVEWGVVSFEATPNPVEPGQPVSLTWEVAAVDSFVLEENGQPLLSHPSGSIPLSGTMDVTPTENAVYTIRTTSAGRSSDVSRTVEVRTFNLDWTGPGPGQRIFPGEKVTLSWDVEALGSETPTFTVPMGELGASAGQPAAYEDVRIHPDAEELVLSGGNGYGAVILPAGFSFPYFGQDMGEFLVWADGYISFNPATTGTSVGTNLHLPNATGNNVKIHLAAFWDDLFGRANDSVWTHFDGSRYIVQWTNFNRSSGSLNGETNGNLYDLNFQIVLYPDGAFEYRYGKMDPLPPPHVNSSCHPSSCVNEVAGSSATIGYQDPTGTFGYTHHFGGSTDAATNVPVHGGLAHRSFRFDPVTSGSVEVTVGQTKDYEICAVAGSFSECKTVTIDPVANPGDLAISELMIDPVGGTQAQWFELRNLTLVPIDLQDFEIQTSSGSHPIVGSLVVPPGGFVTLASSAADVSFVPDYEYGEDLSLDFLFDTLRLNAGTATIASASWDGFWFIPRGKSLSVDPSYQRQGVVSHDDFGRWCEESAAGVGSPGVLGRGCRYPDYDVDHAADTTFFDIWTTGTAVRALAADAGVARIPVAGLAQPFFGSTMARIWASSNGWISFADVDPAGGATASPSSVPRSGTTAPAGPLLAVFWDDLRCDPSVRRCGFHYEEVLLDGEDVLILQWTNFSRGAAQGGITVQAQLWANGDIVVAFDDVYTSEAKDSTAWKYYQGSNAWVGLESADRSHGITAIHREMQPLANRTIRFLKK